MTTTNQANNDHTEADALAWDNYHASREKVETLDGRLNIGYWKIKEMETERDAFLLPDAALTAQLEKFESWFVKLLGDYRTACVANDVLWRALRRVAHESRFDKTAQNTGLWYECGYYNFPTAIGLVEKVRGLNAVLVDIRLNPYSKRPEWQQSELWEMCQRNGVEYLHIPELGNVNYAQAGQPIKIKNLAGGIGQLTKLLETQNIMLMCGGKNLETCHRKTVIEALPQDRKG